MLEPDISILIILVKICHFVIIVAYTQILLIVIVGVLEPDISIPIRLVKTFPFPL